MRRFLLRSFSLLAVFAASSGAPAAVLYESGTLGPTGVTWQQALDGEVPGANVDSTSFQGARFFIDQPSVSKRIGGHFVGPPIVNNTFFGALVELADQNDFPDSDDLSTPDVLGATLLTFPDPSDEVFGEISLPLASGWYAVVFGAGLFGATGDGGVLLNNGTVGPPDLIGFQLGSGWGTRLPGMRFVVEGSVVPEPMSLALALIPSTLLFLRRPSSKYR